MMDVTSVAGDSAHVTSRQITLLSKVASRPVLLEMCFYSAVSDNHYDSAVANHVFACKVAVRAQVIM